MNTHNGLHTSSLECLFCHTVEQCSWDNLYTGTPWTKQMSAHMDTTWSFQSLRLRCRVILISVRESRKKIKVATSNDNSSIIRPNPGGETETNSDMVTFCQISGISGSKFGIEEPTSRVIMMPQCDVQRFRSRTLRKYLHQKAPYFAYIILNHIYIFIYISCCKCFGIFFSILPFHVICILSCIWMQFCMFESAKCKRTRAPNHQFPLSEAYWFQPGILKYPSTCGNGTLRQSIWSGQKTFNDK